VAVRNDGTDAGDHRDDDRPSRVSPTDSMSVHFWDSCQSLPERPTCISRSTSSHRVERFSVKSARK
jgi:hypothetical protein